MKVVFQGTHPKEIGEEKANEDSFAFSNDLTKFILCDGASESYNSQLWAKIICDSFVESDDINDDWLNNAAKKYVLEHDFNNMSWSQLSAYQRGSFSTFASINLDFVNKKIITRLFGDSFIFFFKKNDGKYTYHQTFDIPDFHANPTLISTKIELNSSIDFSKENSNHYLEIPILSNDESIVAICATDALADWFCRTMTVIDHNKLVNIFLTINERKFNRLVRFSRSRGSLKVDDTTLVILEI
ncbi:MULTISPECIES: hypothetical protein [Acinetobacter]|uniref:hypothetical protein n=1 Tax=Acinetobacter TaxID=469 RepID=UPI0012E2CB5F|nr:MULTISPECIES: hypothetical protein [Acinetobacter]